MKIALVKRYMGLALGLAKRAQGQTFPNPLVGAVIVKNGRIVGRGFHKKAGGPHAEIFALKNAGRRAKGASLYCTFEPCSHYGRTGPCVDEIINAGIKEVYIGMIDPNPVTRGKGIRSLRKAGIKVHVGSLKDEISRINGPFIKAVTRLKPFVTIKIAESLDGKVSTSGGESKWITSQRSRIYAHDIRSNYDAIMVGINTVLKDDPFLEPPQHFRSHKLIKVIVDSRLKIPFTARLFKTFQPVIIACTGKNIAKENKLRRMGVLVIHTKPRDGRVDLKELLGKLAKLEIRNVLVEGGPSLIGSFLDNHLADKAIVFIAPKIIGGKAALSSVGGRGIKKLGSAIELKDISARRFSRDIMVEGYLRYR